MTEFVIKLCRQTNRNSTGQFNRVIQDSRKFASPIQGVRPDFNQKMMAGRVVSFFMSSVCGLEAEREWLARPFILPDCLAEAAGQHEAIFRRLVRMSG